MARPGAFGADIGTGSYHNSGPMKVTGLRYQFKQPPGTQKKMTNSRYYQVPGRRHLNSHLSIPHFSTSLISLYLILSAGTQRPLQWRRWRRGRGRGGSAGPGRSVQLERRCSAGHRHVRVGRSGCGCTSPASRSSSARRSARGGDAEQLQQLLG